MSALISYPWHAEWCIRDYIYSQWRKKTWWSKNWPFTNRSTRLVFPVPMSPRTTCNNEKKQFLLFKICWPPIKERDVIREPQSTRYLVRFENWQENEWGTQSNITNIDHECKWVLNSGHIAASFRPFLSFAIFLLNLAGLSHRRTRISRKWFECMCLDGELMLILQVIDKNSDIHLLCKHTHTRSYINIYIYRYSMLKRHTEEQSQRDGKKRKED